MSGSGPRQRRLERLEALALEAEAEEIGLKGPYFDGAKVATEEEIATLQRLRARADEEGRPTDFELDAAFYELWERVLNRASTPAARQEALLIRVKRDAFWRRLDALEKEREEEVGHDEAYYHLSTAAINRKRVVQEGAELITDPEEGSRRAQEVYDVGTDPHLEPHIATREVLRLIRWR